MTTNNLSKNFLAGLFFLLGIFLIVAFIFTLGKDKGLTESKFQIQVIFRDIGGLSEGAPARLSGVNVGNVARIDFLDEPIDGRNVLVVMNIQERFRKQFNQNVHFSIATEGVLGEKLMEISVIEGGSPDLTKPFIGEDPLDVADLTQTFSQAAQSFTKTAEEMSKIDMVELSDVMMQSSRALLTTSESLDQIMKEIDEISHKSKRLFDRLEQKLIEGELFKVF
ncbi:MAG: MCE family protein [Candidatus Omnitrophica bacterium]|nr:MCE family protein [Candidatus Omnitrophota bacterium]